MPVVSCCVKFLSFCIILWCICVLVISLLILFTHSIRIECHSLFLLLSVDGYIGCFKFEDVIICASLNTLYTFHEAGVYNPLMQLTHCTWTFSLNNALYKTVTIFTHIIKKITISSDSLSHVTQLHIIFGQLCVYSHHLKFKIIYLIF